MATVNRIGIAQATGEIVYRDISVKVAPKAECDENGKRITSYITSIEKNSSNLIIKNGKNETSTIGLAMTGATSTSSGAPGFVPQPTSNDRTKVLSGAGTWINTVKSVTLNGNYLNVDGTNLTIPYAGNGISNITRSGTTFTVTRANGSTFTFNQQDTNTTYNAGYGLKLNGNTFSHNLQILNEDWDRRSFLTPVGYADKSYPIKYAQIATKLMRDTNLDRPMVEYDSNTGYLLIKNYNGVSVATLRIQEDGNIVLYHNDRKVFDFFSLWVTFHNQYGWDDDWGI